MSSLYFNSNSANRLAEEIAAGTPILRHPRQQTGRRAEQWSNQLNIICQKVSMMGNLFNNGWQLETQYLQKAQNRLNKIATHIPKKWFFQSDEQKKIEKAQAVVKTLLDPDAIFKRDEALHYKPSYSALPPLKIFNKVSLLCVLAFWMAPPAKLEVNEYTSPVSLLNEANQGMLSTDFMPRALSVDLFKEVIEKGHGIEDAIEAAKNLLLDARVMRGTSVELFEKLIEKGYGIEDAIEAANQGMLNPDHVVRTQSLEVFRKLIKKGHGIEAAIEAAKKGRSDANWTVRSKSRILSEELIVKGHLWD